MTSLAKAIGGEKRVIGGPFGSKLTQRDYVENGVPVIRGGNMQHAGRWIGGDFAYVSQEKYERDLKSNTARPGDIIVTQRGTLGQVSIVPESSPHADYVVSQSQMAVRVDESEASRDFVYYFLKSPVFEGYVEKATIQTGVPHINLGILRDVQVDWPDVQTQNEIARVLASLDEKIELNRRMNETLEEMARALFRDWFIDFGPTRRQIEGATEPAAIMGHAFPPEKAATLALLFPTKLGDDGLPEGWELRDLRSALTLNYGKSLTKKARKPGPFSVFGSGGISGTHDTALAKGPSIIVGRKGTVGSLYWTREDFYAIDTVFYVTSAYPMVYCHRLLETLGLETMNTDAAVPGLNRDNAYRQEFAFGGDDLIHAYAEFVGTLTEKSDANQQENQTLVEMRDLLMPKLMSGEIRLKDAEAAV